MSHLLEKLQTKWQQPLGIRDVLMVAAPLMVSTACYSIMQFVDRLFLLSYSVLDTGAIVTVGTLVWTLCSFSLGIVTYVTAFVAQYRGAEQPGQIGRSVMHAFYLAMASTPFLVLPGFFVEDFFIWFGQSPELASAEGVCFRIYIWSGIGMLINGVLEGLLIGLEKTRPVMAANIYATILNVILDYILIFGIGPLPAMGLEGASWATVIAMWAKSFYTLAVIIRIPELSTFDFRKGVSFDGGFIRRFLFFGGPSGLQWFIEGLAIVYFIAVMGRLGEVYLTATSLAFSINLLAFVPIYGLGMGLTSIIGNQLGQENSAMAKRAMYSALFIAVAFTSFFVVLYTLFPAAILTLHREQTQDFATIEPIILHFLYFVAIYCVFDAVQIVKVSVLKGAGDTWFVTLTFLLTSVLFVLLGSSLDHPDTPPGEIATRWWLALTGWIGTLAIVFSLRVWQGKWLTMKVIESTKS
ncbi:MAG: MATE family efflux transporter [Planctomycetaceae bacterium]|nr:MATE family efflux transporter [Planctomycetaceae bacterium]